MNATSKITVESIRSRLTIGSYKDSSIMLDDVRIGTFVSYGKGGKSTGNVCSQSVYASRIYLQGASIEQEGRRVANMLDKVAVHLARAIKTGKVKI